MVTGSKKKHLELRVHLGVVCVSYPAAQTIQFVCTAGNKSYKQTPKQQQEQTIRVTYGCFLRMNPAHVTGSESLWKLKPDPQCFKFR